MLVFASYNMKMIMTTTIMRSKIKQSVLTLIIISSFVLLLKVAGTSQIEIKIVLLSDLEQNETRHSALLGLRTTFGNVSRNHSNDDDNQLIESKFLVQSIELNGLMSEQKLCEKIVVTNPPMMTFLMDISERYSVGKTLARKMGIPTLRTSDVLKPQYENSGWRNLNEIERNLFISVLTPEAVILHIIKDITTQFGYKSIVIIYDYSFKSAFNSHQIKNVQLKLIFWPSLSQNEIDDTFREVRSNTFSFNVFVLGEISTLNAVLASAYEYYMFGTYKNWYFISKEKGRLRCSECSNIQVAVSQPLRSYLYSYEHEPAIEIANDTGHVVDIFFHYDLARFYAQVILQLASDDSDSFVSLTFPTCGKYQNDDQLKQRTFIKLYDRLATEVWHGVFGQFMFNFNSNLNYQEMTMRINTVTFRNGTVKQISKLAEWEFEGHLGHLYFTSPQEKSERAGIPHYEIVTLIEPPFVMEVNDNETKGNDRFYGYCIDLLKEIVNQSEFRFEYTIHLVGDNQYGYKDEHGEWTGMIGELVRKKADIALGPISVMAEREIVADFTVPYYDLVGISILMKKPTIPSHLFKFLTVLETSVWLCILAAYFFTSFLMYLFDRLSPYSFHNNREKYKDDDEKREFTLKESLWFSLTSLTPQGGGEAPRNLSGRLVAATWWLFGFIIIASYTANLAAFLTVSRLDSPIESLDDLSKQYKIKYAPQAGTSSATYFERMAGIEEKFYEIWKDMSLNDSLSDDERAKLAVWDYPVSDKYTKIWSQILEAKMPQSWSEGMRRVKNEDRNIEQFAFISESTMIKYAVMTNCDLQNIGNEFSRKPLALATQQNSDLKDKLSSAILKLLNQRRLENLKEKWWNRNPEKKDCQDSKKQSDGISINNIGGVFIVILIGVVLACITLVIEYWYFKGKESKVNTASSDPQTINAAIVGATQYGFNSRNGIAAHMQTGHFGRNLAGSQNFPIRNGTQKWPL